MVVVQPTKNKARPILSFREFNAHVACHTGGDTIDIYLETMREWWQMTGAKILLDLKSAYM